VFEALGELELAGVEELEVGADTTTGGGTTAEVPVAKLHSIQL